MVMNSYKYLIKFQYPVDSVIRTVCVDYYHYYFPPEFHHPFASVKAQSEASEEEERSRAKLLFNANNCSNLLRVAFL